MNSFRYEDPVKTHRNPPDTLPEGLILQDRYVVGAQRDPNGVWGLCCYAKHYSGWDRWLDEPVDIQEYYPQFSSHRQGENREAVLCTERNERGYHRSIGTFLRMGCTPERWLEDPNIERIRDCFAANGTWFLVRDLIRGTTLAEYVWQRGKLSCDEAEALLLKTAQVIQRLHDQELIHGGLNPENVILREDGSVLLRDFGNLGFEIDKLCHWEFYDEADIRHHFNHYLPLNTAQMPRYTDTWKDVYSLCALFYFCVTGKAPALSCDPVDWSQVPGLLPHQRAALTAGMAGCCDVVRFVEDFLGTTLFQPVEDTVPFPPLP